MLLYQGGQSFSAQSDPEVSVTFALRDGLAERFTLVRKGITMRGTRIDQTLAQASD